MLFFTHQKQAKRRYLFVLEAFLVIIIIAVGSFAAFDRFTVIPEKKVKFAGKVELKVRIADTAAEIRQGLSGRLSLPQDTGMLFVFDAADYHGFWMKDMKFGLDFIWLNQGEVVDITGRVPAPKTEADEQVIYRPVVPADAVIEVNAGLAETYDIRVGDRLVMN